MTFRDIAKKNLRFNLRKFASFFIVNAFVVCVLFLFGSLLFNDTLNDDAAIQAAQSMIVLAAVVITIFSVIFLTYTGVYFIRSRGREFGVYLTLGMTTKDLSRMVRLESGVIFAGSVALGIVAALLLGNVFYWVLARVMRIEQNLFDIGYGVFLYSIGVLIVSFLIQRVIIRRFINKLSILEITKSAKTTGLAPQRPFVGIVSVLVFIASLVAFQGISTGAAWAEAIVRNFPLIAPVIPVVGMVLSMFYMIGTAIAGIAVLLKKYPRVYQRNILLISGLGHKFRAYRVTLFSITLLITFAIFFAGVGMAFFTYGELTFDHFQPFDFMVERRGETNAATAAELSEIVASAGGAAENFRVLPYIDGRVYRMANADFTYFRHNHFIVSESDFGRFVGLEIDLAHGQLLIATNDTAAELNFHTQVDGLVFLQSDTTMLHLPFVNSNGLMEFARSVAYVLDDGDFYSLAQGAALNEITIFDFAYGDAYAVMAALMEGLLAKNNLPAYTWQRIGWTDPYDRDNPAGLRPISSAERRGIQFRANAFLLFALAFLGLLFLMSSCIVLYHKLVSDSDSDAQDVAQFKRIGLTVPECRSYLGRHIAIVFFQPLLIGGGLGLLLTFNFMSAVPKVWYLFGYVAIMYSAILIFGILLYFVLRRRFFRDVKL